MAPLIVAGYLRMSEKSKRMNSQGKELFRFVPIACASISEVHADFDANRSTILVASGAASDRKKGKQKGDSFMPDLYVLAEIVDEDRKGDEWKARLVEVLGECTDLHSCGLVLAHKGRLMDGNKSLDSNKPPRTDAMKSTQKTVFDKKVATSTATPVVAPQRILSADRVDLRSSKCTIFSVDPPGCVDIDDAVHIRVYSPEERTPLEASVATKLGLDALSAVERSAVLSNTVVYEVGVHIADVVNYVKNHCHAADTVPAGADTQPSVAPSGVDARMEKIVLEALHRSFTVYLPSQQIPILPAYLSHDACSLRAGEDRYTMSCILTIASTATDALPQGPTTTPATPAPAQMRTFVGENTSTPLESPQEERNYKIVSYRFQKSLISSAGAYTYDQVDQFLDNTTSSSTSTAIANTSATATAPAAPTAGKVAPKAGEAGLKGLSKEAKYSLKLFRKLFPALDSHKIVEHLMLMANICAAEFLQAHSGVESVGSAARDVYADTLSAYLLRRQLPAGYDPTNPVATIHSAKGASTTQRGAYTGVPVELTAHPAEYIFCPADTTENNKSGESTTHSAEASLTALEKAHASLGCAVYTHFTSPIRRYADQLVHALMNRLLSNAHAVAVSAGASGSLSGAVAALGLTNAPALDPWIETFTPANIAHINAKQKQHKKFQREMTIVEFVFNQCAAVGSNEATIDAEAVILPMRYSDKHRGYKADLFILAPCSFVYPLRLHTRAQAHLYEATYRADGFSLKNNQTGEVRNLFAGQRIPVQVHCIKSAASLRKKCVVSSPSITF